MKMDNAILNGLKHELTDNNLDMKYHQIWSAIKRYSKEWISTVSNKGSFSNTKHILSLFEFKIFSYSFFLNKLRIDDPEKFKAFTRVCLNQLSLEMEELVLRAEESMHFIIPGHFHRDEEYLIEKLQYYMEDIENHLQKGTPPKYSFVSIIKMPFDHPQDVFEKIQSTQLETKFVNEFNEILKAFTHRYNFTPGVKTQEEIDQQKQIFSSIPVGSETIDPNGIDGYLFGATTTAIKGILGNPEENPRYSGNIDEFLSYKKLGISFGFKNNSLVVVNVYSGRPEGWGDTNFQKYHFRNNVPFTMDSYYEDILKLYGPPLEEKDFPQAKIHCKSLNYGSFNFHFYASNNQLYYFQCKTDNFEIVKPSNSNSVVQKNGTKFLPYQEFEGFKFPMSLEEIIETLGFYDEKRSDSPFTWIKYFSKGIELCFDNNKLCSIQLYLETSGLTQSWNSYSFKIQRDITKDNNESDVIRKYGLTRRDYFGKNNDWHFSLRYPGLTFHINEITNKIVAVYLNLDPTPHDFSIF
jgi:hypothetical protein